MAAPKAEFIDLDVYLKKNKNNSILILPLFNDDTPPKKSTGDVDWKLGAFLSRKIKKKLIPLEKGTFTLVTLPVANQYILMLCISCGERDKFKPQDADKIFKAISTKIKELGIRSTLLPHATLTDLCSETELNSMLNKHFEGLERRWIQ